jgi:hypothetical protein
MDTPATPPSRPPRARRFPFELAALAAVALVAAVGVAWFFARPPAPQDPADRFPLSPLSDSPYLNTRPEAGYIGSDACRACHDDRHHSFRRSGMGRSMALVRPDQEPPDATFDHPASRRRYQIRRKDGRLWHRELLLTDGPEEVLLAEYPLLHVVGSGRHSRTYTAEVDGFLVESPVTWYTSKQTWGMSPGYDSPRQVGFERDVGQGCLICHAGRSEALGRSQHRMRVTELAIGCERCHGPGSRPTRARPRRRGGPKGPPITPSSTRAACRASWGRRSASSATSAPAPPSSPAAASRPTSAPACRWWTTGRTTRWNPRRAA